MYERRCNKRDPHYFFIVLLLQTTNASSHFYIDMT